MFGDGQSTAALGRLNDLADGRYLAGFRPNHLELNKHTPEAMKFNCKLAVTEITGSETFIHLDHHSH